MRRKSARTSAKASPEKVKEEKITKKPRRHSKRHKPTSSESESEDEVSVSSNETVALQTEKELWTVTQTEQSNNDIGKIKICLARPNPATPDRNERVSKRLRNKSQVYSEDSPSEDKPTRRSRRSRGGSSPLKKEELPQQDIEQFDEKKGKGKSKGKHKSKIVDQTENVDEQTEMQSEISENVQVTAQSPQNVDNSDADIVDRDLNQFEDDNSINKNVEEQSLDNQDTNDNIVDASSNDISNNNVANDNQLPPVDVQICNDNENAGSGSLDESCNNTVEHIETSIKLDDEDISMKEVTHFEINDSKVEEVDVKEECKLKDLKTEPLNAVKGEMHEPKAEVEAKLEPQEARTEPKLEAKAEIPPEVVASPAAPKIEDVILQSKEEIKEEVALKAEVDTVKVEPTRIQITVDCVKPENACKKEEFTIVPTVEDTKIESGEDPVDTVTKSEAVEEPSIIETKTEATVTAIEEVSLKEEERTLTPEPEPHVEPPKQAESLASDKTEVEDENETSSAPEPRITPEPDTQMKTAPGQETLPPLEIETITTTTEIETITTAPEIETITTPEMETLTPERETSPEPIKLPREMSVDHDEDSESKDSVEEQPATRSRTPVRRPLRKSDSTSSTSSSSSNDEEETKEKSISDDKHYEESTRVSEPKTTLRSEEESSAQSQNRKIQKRWGESTNLKDYLIVTSSQLLKMYPTLTLLEENLVKLNSGAPRDRERDRERGRGRERLQEIEKHIERRVSISVEEKPERKDSTTPTATNNTDNSNLIALNRKISIVEDEASSLRPPPSPASHDKSSVLFITNLVRPFTVKQLRGLLERTGKFVEGGFWTDKIKSKCYVQYETEGEAEATRNALHGVQWPIGNGKKLIIDFSTVEELENCKNPPVVAPVVPLLQEVGKENQELPKKIPPKDTIEKEEVLTETREWPERNNDERVRSRPLFSPDVKRRRSLSKRSRSRSPEIKKKREESVHQRAMDDLFRKTEATPSIYWQPLSPEEIAFKQQQRLERLETHKRKMESQQQIRPRRNSDRARGGGGPYRRRY